MLTVNVIDPKGAAVPAAKVVLQSTRQNLSRGTDVNVAGAYSLSLLPPGQYELVVEAPGFQRTKIEDLRLFSGQATTLQVQLSLATNTESVTVTSAPPLLQTMNATLGNVVDSKQVNELPLLARNFTFLVSLNPGVAPIPSPDSEGSGAVGQTGLNPSVYGQRQRSNNYTLDGLGNVNLQGNSPIFFPPPEAIEEVKIESGMQSGASGWGSGASINVVSKSGSNAFHGNAWEYVRNEALDARSFFVPKLGTFRWNQFGAAIGGPLSRKKGWYFHGYYEGVRNTQATNSFNLVPTPAQLSGDFTGSAPIYNPFTTIANANGSVTRQPFPSNQIPRSLLNRSAATIANGLFPAPNLAPNQVPGANLITTDPRRNDGDQYSLKVDHQFRSKDTFSARYSRQNNPSVSFPGGLPTLPEERTWEFWNLSVSDTHVFSPSFLVTGRLGLNRGNRSAFVTGDLSLARNSGTLESWPAFEADGRLSPPRENLPTIGIPGIGTFRQGFDLDGPKYFIDSSVSAQNFVGRHIIDTGFNFNRTLFFVTSGQNRTVDFSPIQTSLNNGGGSGVALASFLLGVPDSAQRLFGGPTADMEGNAYSFYVNDTFRITKKLTLNMGLRYDYVAPLVNRFGMGTFQWETGQYFWNFKNPITGEPANVSPGMVEPDRNNFAPRFGVAYQVSSKTVVRSGYSIFYDLFGSNYAQTAQGARGGWPFASPENLQAANRGGVPTALFPNPFVGPARPTVIPLGGSQMLNLVRGTSRTPYVQQWNFSLQHQITPSVVAELVYFGSHGVKVGGQIVDNTAVSPGPGAVAARQSWPNFRAIYTMNGYNSFHSYYHGASLRIEKRFSQGLSLQGSYTYAKNLGNVDSLVSGGPFGTAFFRATRPTLNLQKGLLGFDLRHRLVLSYIYELPLKSRNRLVQGIAGNWSLTGVASFDSGFPFVSLLSFDNANIGTTHQFPNIVGDPNAISNRTPQKWFNTEALSVPDRFTFGSAGRRGLAGPAFQNWDFSMFKRWPFGETRHLQLRAEFFNFTNHANFAAPGAILETAQFGRISATRNPGRQTQLSLKLAF